MKLIVPIIWNKSLQPVPRATVRLNVSPNSWVACFTDENGMCSIYVDELLDDTQLEVYACDYKDLGTHVNLGIGDKQIRVGMPADNSRPQDIILPALDNNKSDTIIRPVPKLPDGTYDKFLPWIPPLTRDYLRADAWSVVVPNL